MLSRPTDDQPWSLFMEWLEKGDPQGILDEARKEDDNAINICDYLLSREDLPPLIRARAYLLRGRLYAVVKVNVAIDALQRGIEIAGDCIPNDDPEFVKSVELLQSITPVDPDWQLVNEQWSKIEALLQNGYQADELSNSARVVLEVMRFDSHVLQEGLSGYFENRGDSEQGEILNAFAALSTKASKTIKKCFKAYEKAETVSAARAGKKKKSTPEQDAEEYDKAFDKAFQNYSDLSAVLVPMVADYIRENIADFEHSAIISGP